jgi:hypothetical protein
MDKMGESEKAHNKGLPGTSRDGAPIEITGLLKSALRWVIELEKAGHFKWTKVKGKVLILSLSLSTFLLFRSRCKHCAVQRLGSHHSRQL